MQYENFTERKVILEECRDDLKTVLMTYQKDIEGKIIAQSPATAQKPMSSKAFSHQKTSKNDRPTHPNFKIDDFVNEDNGTLYPSILDIRKRENALKKLLLDEGGTEDTSGAIAKIIKIYMKKLELVLENRDIQWEKKLINSQFDQNFSGNTYDEDVLRSELESNIDTDAGRKLFQKLLSLQSANRDLERQNNRAKSILSSLRLNYFKELNNLRELTQPWRTNDTIKDYLKVRYFTPTEGIDKNIVEILNSKLKEMKLEYDHRITILSEDCNQMAMKIQAYQELAPDSYGLLDMTLEQIFEGVKTMEKDPEKLWNLLVKSYTRRFFDSIIESEYKEYLNEVSTREMVRSINKIKKEMTEQLNDVRLSMEAEKTSLRYQINMKIEESEYLRSSNINMINRARRDASQATEKKFNERLDQMYKKFDEEKHELHQELNSLKNFAEDHNYLQNRFSMQLALAKFRFTIQVMKVREGQQEKPIRDIVDELRRVIMGRQIQEHEEREKELEDLKLEHTKIKIMDANHIFKMHEMNEEITLLKKNLQDMQDENGSVSSMLARERQDVRQMKLEIKSLSNGDKINKDIIEVLENDKAQLKEQIEQLSKQLGLKDPDFIVHGDLRDKNSRLFIQKALQKMNQEKFESMSHIIREDIREIGTMTEMRGTENEIILNSFDNNSDLPSIPKLNAIVQTDNDLHQGMRPDIPLSDVKAYNKINALENELSRLKKAKGYSENTRMFDHSDEGEESEEESPEIKVKKRKPRVNSKIKFKKTPKTGPFKKSTSDHPR